MVYTVNNLKELIETIDTVKTKLKFVNWWFRGQENSSWKLLPSVFRNYTKEQECSMAYDFYIKSNPILKNIPEKNNFAAWLTLMQHYGLPTRLLDWSSSPLVACYFATCNNHFPSEDDSCIWMVAPSGLNKYFGYEKYLYPFNDIKVCQLVEPAFKHIFSASGKVMACWAVERNIRVYVQQSAFTVHDSNCPLSDFEGASDWLVKIIIPKLAKQTFQRTLKLCGIEKSRLFPDMEHISAEIRNNEFLE